MLRVLVICAALTVAAAAQSPGQPQGQPWGPACCELWVFEPAGGASIGYAVEARSGATMVVEETRGHAFRAIEGEAARDRLRAWRAASRKSDASSILIDAPTSHFNLGPFPGARDDDREAQDGDTLILIRNASAAKARHFIDDIDHLPASMNALMKGVIPARGG